MLADAPGRGYTPFDAMGRHNENELDHVQLIKRLQASLDELANYTEMLNSSGAVDLANAVARLRDELSTFLAEQLANKH